MRHFGAAIVGRDRPGIVAGVTLVLLEHGVNLEDSQMTILRGHFTMMLVLAAPDAVDGDALRDGLERLVEELRLEWVSLQEVPEIEAGADALPTHIVSVYGVDHPGIVHAVAAALARRSVNITDLQARVAGEASGQPLYSMVLEVALQEGLGEDELRAALEAAGGEQGVEVSVRPLEPDVL
jgi:glycine cleavage system transcriptional repressor